MSKFQDGFFQDLWCDMVLREADSIYCRFLLEEKKEQAYLAEHEEKKAVHGCHYCQYDDK